MTFKDKVLEAAAVEFAEHGFGGARVDRIGRLAGVSKGTIYYHFKSKRALYQLILRSIYEKLSALLSAIASSPSTPAERMADVVTEVGTLYVNQPAAPVLLMRELCEAGKHLDTETFQVFADVPRLFLGMLREGISDGSLRNIPELVAYYFILGPVQTFIAGVPFRQRARRQTRPTVYGAADGRDEAERFIRDFRSFLLEVLPAQPVGKPITVKEYAPTGSIGAR